MLREGYPYIHGLPVFKRNSAKYCHIVSCSVAMSLFSLGGWMKGRGACVRSFGHEYDFCQAAKAETPIPA